MSKLIKEGLVLALIVIVNKGKWKWTNVYSDSRKNSESNIEKVVMERERPFRI